jgi:RND superfamily putative drug exporter
MFERLAHLAYRRRWTIIGVWLLLLVVSVVGAYNVGSVLGPGDFVIEGSSSAQAAAILNRAFHQDPQRTLLVVVRGRRPHIINAPSFQTKVASVARRIRTDLALRISYLDNPLVAPRNAQLIARNGQAVAVLASSRLSEQNLESHIDSLRARLRTSGVDVWTTGTAPSDHDFAVSSQQDLANGRVVIVPLLIVLILVFGSLVATGLPLMLALFSIPLSLSGVYLLGHVINTSIYAANVVEVLGIGVAVDYSLFIVSRFREELNRSDNDVETALVATMTTTGRAVFFSGITVALGLGALILTGVTFMQSMGLAGILVPVSAVLTAMTLLPSVLSVLGDRVNRARVLPSRLLHPGERGPWHQMAHGIMRRPWVAGGCAVVVLIALAFPTLHLAYSQGSLRNAPHNLESVRGYVYMRRNFPTTPDPIEIVVERHGVGNFSSGPPRTGLLRVEAAIGKVRGIRSVTGPSGILEKRFLAAGAGGKDTIALIVAVPTATVGTQFSSQILDGVNAVIHRHLADLKGDTSFVGGAQAEYSQWNDIVLGRFPWVVAIILVLTYCFLFYAFRSAFLPLKAVLLNLLSVGAAYGVLVLVFQGGVGSSVLNFVPETGVATWVPIFLFAFLFGLSMDYEVVLLSRVREAWLSTGNNRESVAYGLEKTGRLITSAALIMVIAFTAFLIGHQIQLKEFGLGLLFSVAIDASLVRVVLVPAIMEVMGDRNWWAPGWLRSRVSKPSGGRAH